jgi:hypothetical protein
VSIEAAIPMYARGTATRAGGVFYLLNAAIALGWFGDFTAPRHRGLPASPWQFLMVAGSQLTPRGLARDPLWPLLARLHGAEPQVGAITRRTFNEQHLPVLRAALARALGRADARSAARCVCVQRARVTTTATHVDVWFGLASHPVAIRLAGLDRTPGWIPAAGRVVTFHYD